MTEPAQPTGQPTGPAVWPLPAGPAPHPGATTAPATSPAGPAAPPTATARVVGLVLLAPALVLLLVQWVVPTLATVVDSFREVSPFTGRGDLVGLDNYRLILSFLTRADVPGLPVVWTFAIAAVSILSALGIAQAARGGAWARRLARGCVVVLLALVSPVAVTLGWQRLLSTDLFEPGPGTVLIAVLCHAPAATGLLSLALLASADRRAGPVGRRTPALVVVLALVVAAAAGIQLYDLPALLDPSGSALGPAAVEVGFAAGSFGAAAAAGVMMLIPLGALGLVAVALVVNGRLRLLSTPRTASTDQDVSPGRGIVGATIALGSVAIAAVAFGPVVAGWSAPLPLGAGDLVRAVVAGLLPAVGSAILQLTVSVAAGFGVGRLAPLGRRSPWLLFAFAPWALCGRLPFMLSDYTFVREVGLLDSPLGLIPPVQVSPTVVVLTAVLFAATRPEHGRHRLGPLPVAGLLTLIGGVITVAQASTVQWSILVVASTDLFTGPLALRSLAFADGGQTPLPTAYAYGPVALVITLAVAAAVVAATSRIALRSGPLMDLEAGPAAPVRSPQLGVEH